MARLLARRDALSLGPYGDRVPEVNEFGQPVGDVVPGWKPRDRPVRIGLIGRYVALQPVSTLHVPPLFLSLCGPERRGALDLPDDAAARDRGRAGRPRGRLDGPGGGQPHLGGHPDRRRGGRDDVLLPDRARARPGRGGGRRLRAEPPAHPGGHRGDVPADALRVRRPGLPAVRVEVRRAQRAVPAGGAAARVHLRGPVPQPPGDQGPQPGHRLVLGDRRRVAGAEAGVPDLARSPTTSTRQGNQRLALSSVRDRLDG